MKKYLPLPPYTLREARLTALLLSTSHKHFGVTFSIPLVASTHDIDYDTLYTALAGRCTYPEF